MKIIERIKLRNSINFLISVLERLVNLLLRVSGKSVKPEEKKIPERPRPIKKIINKIENIIPFPWNKR